MFHTRLLRSVALVLLPAYLQARPAAAQDTRSATIAAAQAEKAKQLRVYEPNALERRLLMIEREFLVDPSGFYPYFGSVYSGGGFTLGAGYRRF
jgi:hypothetical protein